MSLTFGHSSIFRASVIASLIALLGLTSFAQPPRVLAPHKLVPPPLPQPKAWHKPAVPRSLVGGLWMIDANMKSSIYLRNDLETSPLTVTPILYLSNGTKFSLAPVKLESAGTAIVSINQALADNGIAPYATLSGYVEVQYNWPWDALCATVRNIDAIHSLLFNYNLPLAGEVSSQGQSAAGTLPQTQIIEGMWWKQERNVTGFVALSNPLSQFVDATVTVSDNFGNAVGAHPVAISPNGTKRVNLDELQQIAGSMGGIRISYNGPDNGLLVNGGLEDLGSGYSANIPFSPAPVLSSQPSEGTYAELGLMVGPADPMMLFPVGTVFTPYSVMRNISGQPISVTPSLYWMSGGASRSTQLAQFVLQPYQTMSLNVMTLLAQAGLQNFSGSVNLVLNVKGNIPRGGLLMASGSVDQKNTYVFQVAPQDIRESVAKTLSYWSTGNGDDTMVTLWNPADDPQDFVFTLFYSGGHYGHPVHLEGRATQMFNISEIIHNQIPDSEGNTIPLSVYEGSAEISGVQGESEHILIAMEAGTYNVQKATCGTWCTTCQGAVDWWIVANPFVVATGDTNQLAFKAQYHSGAQYDYTSGSSWSSTNTTVATVNIGLVTGVAPGSVTIAAKNLDVPDYYYGCGGSLLDCPVSTGGAGSAGGTVSCKGTTDCSYYDRACQLAPYPTSQAYYCNIAPPICKNAGTTDLANCVRLCLQVKDVCLFVPDPNFAPCQDALHTFCGTSCGIKCLL